MERFRAYEGNESYAFISYAHMDSDRVYEIISALNNDGFRLWYDQGIEIARRYKAIINEHIEKCAAFVVFATRNGIKREEVIDECAYAIALRKKMIIVYLEDIPAEELDAALRATFTINQCIMWYKYADWERKYKLYEALEECSGEFKDQQAIVSEGHGQAIPKVAQNRERETEIESTSSSLRTKSFTQDKKRVNILLVGILLFFFPILFGSIYYSEFMLTNPKFLSLDLNNITYDCLASTIGLWFTEGIILGYLEEYPWNQFAGTIIPVSLLCTILKVLPLIFAIFNSTDTTRNRKIFKKLNLISVFAVLLQWIGLIVWYFVVSIKTFGSFEVSSYSAIEHLSVLTYSIPRDFTVVASSYAVFGKDERKIFKAVKYTKLGIITLIIFSLLISLMMLSVSGETDNTLFAEILLSRTICFPWLALFLMKIAQDRFSQNQPAAG